MAPVARGGSGARAAGADRVVELPFDTGALTAEMVGLVG